MQMTLKAVVFLIAAACAFGAGQGENKKPEPNDARREVRQLQDLLREAQMWHDTATLERVYADDYILTEDDGTPFTKRQRIAALGKLEFASIDVRNVRVRVYNGDTAVLNYTATVSFRVKPTGPFTVQVTSVAVKRKGKWQFVAGHESFIRANP